MAELVVEDLRVHFGAKKAPIVAVDGVSLTVPDGGVVGLVGESGSGKSTVARTIVGIGKPTSGRILLGGEDLLARRRGVSAVARAKDVQMIFQDPYSSLNPRMTVGEALDEVLSIHAETPKDQRPASIRRLLDLVRLKAGAAEQYPAEMSGGMRQRVAIARALAVRPRLIVADEITSALDASVQGAVLNLIKDLREELGLSMLFITHNLAAVRYIADSVAVMHRGRIVEQGPSTEVVADPREEYTRELVGAIPRIENAGTDYLLRSLGEK